MSGSWGKCGEALPGLFHHPSSSYLSNCQQRLESGLCTRTRQEAEASGSVAEPNKLESTCSHAASWPHLGRFAMTPVIGRSYTVPGTAYVRALLPDMHGSFKGRSISMIFTGNRLSSELLSHCLGGSGRLAKRSSWRSAYWNAIAWRLCPAR